MKVLQTGRQNNLSDRFANESMQRSITGEEIDFKESMIHSSLIDGYDWDGFYAEDDDGLIVGAISFAITPVRVVFKGIYYSDENQGSQKCLYVKNLGSLKKGVGTILVNAVLDAASKKNLPTMAVSLIDSLGFYRKLKFSELNGVFFKGLSEQYLTKVRRRDKVKNDQKRTSTV